MEDFAEDEKKLKELYEGISAKIKKTDTTLVAASEAELQKQLNFLEALKTKLLRSAKRKEETVVQQIRNTKEKLFPGGVMQERVENFIPGYLNYGIDFFDLLKNNLNPLEFEINCLDTIPA
jgi:uncharacterized protein YllA (UPF0747 family)